MVAEIAFRPGPPSVCSYQADTVDTNSEYSSWYGPHPPQHNYGHNSAYGQQHYGGYLPAIQEQAGSVIGSAVDMPQFDPAEKRGAEIQLEGEPFRSQRRQPLQYEELYQQSAKLFTALQNLSSATESFINDGFKSCHQKPEDERELTVTSQELLDELVRKIRPYICKLDEDIQALQAVVKSNLDCCRLTDPRLDWLLSHYQHLDDFRKLLKLMAQEVFDYLERVIELNARGYRQYSSKDGSKARQPNQLDLLARQICKHMEQVKARLENLEWAFNDS